jgi:hypothetical protein
MWLQLFIVAGVASLISAATQRRDQSENYVEQLFPFEYRLFVSSYIEDYPEGALESLRVEMEEDLRGYLVVLGAPVTIQELVSENRGT